MKSETARQSKQQYPTRETFVQSEYNRRNHKTTRILKATNQTLLEMKFPYLVIYKKIKSPKHQFTPFIQIPNTAESFQMTLNPYLMN